MVIILCAGTVRREQEEIIFVLPGLIPSQSG